MSYGADKDPDIVQLILDECINLGFDAAHADLIRRRICGEYGGQRIYIKKNRQATTEDKRKRVFQDGVTQKSTGEIIKEHGISRATLYRWMKRG